MGGDPPSISWFSSTLAEIGLIIQPYVRKNKNLKKISVFSKKKKTKNKKIKNIKIQNNTKKRKKWFVSYWWCEYEKHRNYSIYYCSFLNKKGFKIY